MADARDDSGTTVRPAVRNELSGTVTGPVVQSAAIHGGVHIHTGPVPPPAPRQLPPPPAHLAGRSHEIDALHRLTGSGAGSVVVLCGPAGVGKSALARWWAHEARAGFPDGQLYADLGGYGASGPVDPGEVLGAFLRALGLASERIPGSLAERTALYRTVTADTPLLLLLDDAYSAAQVRPLLPTSASVVLVTSRRRLTGLVADGGRMLDVRPLPPADSMRLLSRAVGDARIDREGGSAGELAQLCGGLPLALTVAAGRLAARPLLSVRTMVADLADENERLARLAGPDDVGVRTVFDVSYRDLSPPAAALYRRLAQHPGNDFGPGLATALVDAEPMAHGGAFDVLGELLGVSLLEEIDEDRFRFHDLLRLHARETAEKSDDPVDRRAALLTILEYHLAAARNADQVVTPYRRRLPYTFRQPAGAVPEFADRSEALAWLVREQANLVQAGRAALENGFPELAWLLCDALWPLLLYIKNYQLRLEVDRRGVTAARQWGHVWAEAHMLKRLSRASMRVGAYDDAERYGRAAVERYREADDVRGELDAREGLATLCLETGREEEAGRLLVDVLAANRALGEPRSVGLTCVNLAALWTRSGRAVEALPLLTEAGQIFADLGDVDPYNAARVSIGLASAYLGVGDLDAAERAAGDAVDRMAALGSANERAEALTVLGEIAEQRGDTATARRHLEEALAVFTSLASPRAGEVATRLDRDGVRRGDHQAGQVGADRAE
ncbi:tetratricopeptide repeat protein [Micromonospora sp. NBRC 101691]|uniref:tetratricopeptide repeat protein n=1 Tax=Micromonospora sp. NBRC 101691 TaxID=3032198 RepID=UPI0024A44035|nr:tetratricopeptide repeat protein [Micromonospora sp. NBRC 101691]GLY24470.1 NTPase [Micromonospora sp. NBRC 101691]